jgi:hypothetical protein
VTRTIIIPDVAVLRADWDDRLAATLAHRDQRDALWAAVGRMHDAARDVAALGPERAKADVARAYGAIRAILCHGPLGTLALWPPEFWRDSLGRTIFYCFVVTHGDDLLYPKQAARILGVDTPRLGQLQRLGKIDYVIDADARHPRQETRRVTRAMVGDYLAHRATPRALRRYYMYGDGKEDGHVSTRPTRTGDVWDV